MSARLTDAEIATWRELADTPITYPYPTEQDREYRHQCCALFPRALEELLALRAAVVGMPEPLVDMSYGRWQCGSCNVIAVEKDTAGFGDDNPFPHAPDCAWLVLRGMVEA